MVGSSCGEADCERPARGSPRQSEDCSGPGDTGVDLASASANAAHGSGQPSPESQHDVALHFTEVSTSAGCYGSGKYTQTATTENSGPYSGPVAVPGSGM